MTEAEWLACVDPRPMLALLHGVPATERKWRLFNCAYCRRVMRPSLDPRGWRDVEEAERYAEGRQSVAAVPGFFDISHSPFPGVNGEAALLRDLFGSPFSPVAIATDWLTPSALSLAQAAYDERIMPRGELDPARLAVLADALEEAGCTDPDLLGHLRSPGPHVRGCWALDLILGKE
jgi:hypothetical protein